MNLMNMLRLCGMVAIGWTLGGLESGVFRPHRRPAVETTFFLPEPALHAAVALSVPTLGGRDEYRLVDRSTGAGQAARRCLTTRAGDLCASRPGATRKAIEEAVGRWNRSNAAGGQAFCGLGLFSLADPTVVHSIDLDVLPTGRPCWVPGRPGDLLFPGGDGQLHRCHLARDRTGTQGLRIRAGMTASSARRAATQAGDLAVCRTGIGQRVHLRSGLACRRATAKVLVRLAQPCRHTTRGSCGSSLQGSGGSRCRIAAMRSCLPAG